MKKITRSILALGLVLGIAVGAQTAYAQKGYQCEGNVCYAVGTAISLEQAKNIAFNHAGVMESDVRMKKAKLDREKGRLVYEIEFYYNNVEYEYDIDAANGNIIKFEKD